MVEAPSASGGPRISSRLVVLLLLLVLTVVARMPTTLGDALWQDEVGTERIMSQPDLRGVRERIVLRESTPPGFFVAAWVADRVVSPLEAVPRARAVRFISVAASVGCTWLTVVLAWELMSLWAAALAGVLVSLGSILVVQGSLLRAYSLLAFSCVAFAFLLGRAVARPGLVQLGLLAGAVALGSMTHYFFLLTLAAGLLWLLVSRPGRSVVVRISAAVAVGLIPLALWSPSWLQQYRHGIYATAPPLTFARFAEFFPSLFAPHPAVDEIGVGLAAILTFAVLLSALLLLAKPEGRLCAILVLAPFLVVCTMVWITGERVFNTRNLIGVAPFAAIALAWGCAALPWRRASYAAGALVGVLVLAGFVYGEASLGRTPYDRIAAEMVAQGYRAEDPILWFGGYGGIFPVAWYLTADEPGNRWPLIRLSSPTGRPCRAVTVVARTATSRRWLEEHRDQVLAQSSVPGYGDVTLGRRGLDVIVARLAWSPGILDRPEGGPTRYRLHRADTRSECLQP